MSLLVIDYDKLPNLASNFNDEILSTFHVKNFQRPLQGQYISELEEKLDMVTMATASPGALEQRCAALQKQVDEMEVRKAREALLLVCNRAGSYWSNVPM